MLTVNDLKTIKSRIDQCIRFVSDEVIYDDPALWNSFAGEILNNTKFKTDGDCEDFAITYAEMCVAKGFGKDQVSIVMCLTPSSGFQLVCTVDLDGTRMVLCNEQKEPISWEDSNYQSRRVMPLSTMTWK